MANGRIVSNSGSIVQLQNLYRNSMPDLAQARTLVKQGNYAALEALYDSVPEVLAQCVRTAFISAPGYKFIVSDFSAIEARVLSWLAGEQWRMDSFARGEDIYCASASQMFGVPVEKHGINGHLRQKGKQAELACIAEGSLVLTDRGLVPIEKVTTDMKVWDGKEWVHHDGVVYRGQREVINYEGLTATPDHLVWVEGQPRPIQFGLAAAGAAHLVQTGAPQTGPAVRTARVYDILNAGPNHRFTVSGHLVHNCGYGGGVGALKAMGALEMGLSEDELQPLVSAWRQANPRIVQFWWAVDHAVTDAVTRKTTTKTHGIVFSCRSGMLFITLPSGRNLAYVKPRIGQNKFGGTCITYEGIGATKKWERIDSYGPKFVENCIAKGTQVITARGLVAIEDIRADDKIWDGIEYVSHDGLIYQGTRNVNNVNNILMTPDHKILTERGWKRNAESDGLNWAAVSLPDGTTRPIADISVISTGLTKPVYDIGNCGPRHRFAVWANGRAYIVSNCVQGIARDILCYAMKTLRCCNIVMHIHDELVIEVDRGVSLQAICEQMSRTPPWAEGLRLRADGYETEFYKKD